jgi:uracil-DNA glycosylase
MTDEFSNEEIEQLVQLALSEDYNKFNPSNGLHLGYAESSLLENLALRLENRFAHSELNEIIQDLRSDLIAQKISFSIKDLHTQVLNCRKCKNFKPDPTLPMWNVKNPDIVFVLDYPIYNREVAEFFLSTLKAANFSSDRVCLTYLNRCSYPKRKFEPQEIFNCSPYLHLELQMLNPKLIVSLGSVTAASLFGKDLTIKDYRGKITWIGSWPVLVTYSPTHIAKTSSHLIENFNNDIIFAYDYLYKKETYNEHSSSK